jgi:hypothetical protein
VVSDWFALAQLDASTSNDFRHRQVHLIIALSH